jgi:glycosyltransferase involved in cell wall biosynthesis
VLQTADEVIVVGNTMKQEFQPLRKQDIHVITNGYDEDDFKSLNAKSVDSTVFNILHLGSINVDRNHGIFWEALQQLMDENRPFKEALKLTFIGKNDYSVKAAVSQYHLESKTHFETYIPHNQVAERMAVADLLYLPLNNTPNAKGIVSGKLFEYLASHRPILALAHPDGDAAHILNETQAGITCDFEDVEAVKEAMRYYFKQKLDGLGFSSKGIEAYSRLNLTRKLAELLG